MAFGNVQPFYLDTSNMENALSGLFAAQKKKKEDETYGGLLNSLSGGPGPMPQQQPVNALAMQPQAPAAPSSGNVPASIRYNNPGAMWPGPSSQKFGATGAGVIGGGNKIAQFDSPESGAAAQFDLLARKYAGKPLGAAIAQWSGGNSSPAYAASIAKATGLDPNAVLTPDMLRNPSVAVPLAKAMARWEAGREFPLDDNGWTRAHAMAMGGGRPQQAAPQVAGGGNQAAILAWARANPAHPAAQEIARSMAGQALDPTAGIKMQQAQANLQGTLTEQQRAGLEFYGKQAMAISQLPETSPQRAAAWQQLLQRHSAEHPEDEITSEEANPVTGPQLMAAQAGQYLDPRRSQIADLELKKTQAEIAKLEAEASGKGGKHGLVPIYGTDEKGNIVLLQAKETGGVDQAALPPGVTISKAPIKLDAGDHFVLLDPITRQPVGQVAKNVAEAASLKEQGESQGKARANIPVVEANADRIIKQIDELVTDKGLDRVTGTYYGRMPSFTNTSEAAKTAQSRIDQVLGGAFLQAYNDLRGAGQISNQEGQSAKAAYTRLQNQEMGTPEYRNALIEFKNEVQKLTDIARVKAGLQPKYGSVDDISTAIDAAKPRVIDMGDGFKLEAH